MTSRRTVGDVAFFWINFAVSVGLVVLGAFAIVQSESPGAYLGGWMFLVVGTCYAVMELRAMSRRDPKRQRRLGILNLGGAGLAAFGFASNVGEAIVYGDSNPLKFWLIFAAICGTIIAYLTFCGVYRIRRARATAGSLL